jgi:hypothetical protein
MWLADKLTDQDGCSVSFLDVLAPDMDSLVLPTSATFGSSAFAVLRYTPTQIVQIVSISKCG